MKNISGVAIVLIIIAAAGGFYGGMKYQQSTSPIGGQIMRGQDGQRTRFQGGNGGAGGNAMRGGGQGFQPVMGEIISSDDKSITVKTDDGSSKIVVISTKTSINKSSEGSNTDLKVGEKVAVFGSENTDGSVTAQSVQLNPQMRQVQITGTPNK